MRRLVLMLLAVALVVCACTNDSGHIDLTQTEDGTGIASADDLIAFFESSGDDTATLIAPIELGNEMLKLTVSRGAITIDGNGLSVTGGGDCVIRLDDGCSITLNNVTVTGGSDAIGCLGGASVSGTGSTVSGGVNGISCAGKLCLSGELSIEGISGAGITAKGIDIGENASISTVGMMGAVHTTKNDLVLKPNSCLYAETEEYYNAVKCAARLVLEKGSLFSVVNNGLYHGAEIEKLAVNGVATVEARGGEKGVGLFIVNQEEDIVIPGSCEPMPRFESGDGSISFTDNENEVVTTLDVQNALEQQRKSEQETDAAQESE